MVNRRYGFNAATLLQEPIERKILLPTVVRDFEE